MPGLLHILTDGEASDNRVICNKGRDNDLLCITILQKRIWRPKASKTYPNFLNKKINLKFPKNGKFSFDSWNLISANFKLAGRHSRWQLLYNIENLTEIRNILTTFWKYTRIHLFSEIWLLKSRWYFRRQTVWHSLYYLNSGMHSCDLL